MQNLTQGRDSSQKQVAWLYPAFLDRQIQLRGIQSRAKPLTQALAMPSVVPAILTFFPLVFHLFPTVCYFWLTLEESDEVDWLCLGQKES